MGVVIAVAMAPVVLPTWVAPVVVEVVVVVVVVEVSVVVACERSERSVARGTVEWSLGFSLSVVTAAPTL